ncbi:MAG: hypothetical protein ACLSH6_00235 [Limosilactobacillus pontis]
MGKIAYLASSTWANGRSSSEKQKPFIIAAGDKSSSNITVTEQDKINVAIHFKDKDGNDKTVVLPDQAKTYDYGDLMSKSDFLTGDKDLTAADKALLPSKIYIDYANPTIQNSKISMRMAIRMARLPLDKRLSMISITIRCL